MNYLNSPTNKCVCLQFPSNEHNKIYICSYFQFYFTSQSNYIHITRPAFGKDLWGFWWLTNCSLTLRDVGQTSTYLTQKWRFVLEILLKHCVAVENGICKESMHCWKKERNERTNEGRKQSEVIVDKSLLLLRSIINGFYLKLWRALISLESSLPQQIAMANEREGKCMRKYARK